ncbi:MAG TPA: hypothetical protein PK400_02215 [Phycisphaerales bacterium]|nr:hypothetical protein [Phycisphaerales bacterium]HRQ76075.1 hypothetical protein [Phycisphaerales bacterium]
MNFNDHNSGENFQTHTGPAGGVEREERTMPLGMGDFNNADEAGAGGEVHELAGSFGGESKRRLNGGGLVLVAVVLTAIGGLYSMRTLTKASAASDQTSAVEKSINEFIDGLMGTADTKGAAKASKGRSTEAVLDVLTETYTKRQVPLSDVQRNPFVIFDDVPVAPVAPVVNPVEFDPKVQLRKDRAALFEQAGARVRVRTIMMGSSPLANIDNKIVRMGDSITVEPENVEFVVVAIAPDFVELKAEDKALEVVVRVTVNLRRDR